MSPVSQKSTVRLSYLFSHVFWQLVIYMIGYFAFLGIQKGITQFVQCLGLCLLERIVGVLRRYSVVLVLKYVLNFFCITKIQPNFNLCVIFKRYLLFNASTNSVTLLDITGVESPFNKPVSALLNKAFSIIARSFSVTAPFSIKAR